MQRRRLGRLGHDSSVLLYGGAALGEVTQDVADASVAEALEAGINHFDVAADYGEAELRLGALMDDLRPQVFLATKTGLRDREPAWAQINASLERLRTDRIDLLQLHAIGDLDELDRATRPGGALEAAIRAQEAGLVGAVGITGHGHEAPATHLEALRRYPFDTVLTPWNYVLSADESYSRDFEALVEEVKRQDAGLMAIKTVSRRNWPEGDPLRGQRRATWYEPFEEQGYVDAAVSFVLAREEISGIPIVGDVGLIRTVIEAEGRRMPLERAEEVLSRAPEYSSPFISIPF